MFDLRGKVALVTGASSGLGADAAVAYAEAGADLALMARRKEKLEETAVKIRELGRKALIIEADITDESNVKEGINKIIGEYGKIDILLNNAGTVSRGGVHQLPLEEWKRVMDVNINGMFLVSKYVIPHMQKAKYGKIVNISSINAIVMDKGEVNMKHAYNTSKAAVIGMTRAMAASYGEDNITVNAVNPGLFKSEMTEGTLFKQEKFLDFYNSMAPLSRPGRQGELNGPILFLSSDASSYVTGQFLLVDGGLSIT